MAMVSPTWSPWPCETRMKSAATSSALTAALGVSVMKGSMSTRLPSLSRDSAACPSQRTRVAMVVVLHRSQGCNLTEVSLNHAPAGRSERIIRQLDPFLPAAGPGVKVQEPRADARRPLHEAGLRDSQVGL